MALKRKKEYEIEIEKLVYGGKGIGKIDGMAVFVPYGVPGDRLKISVSRKRKNYAEAVLREIITPSPLRQEPKCDYFGHCGGCKWQNISYEEQLKVKHQIVKESLEHIAGLDNEVQSVLAAPQAFAYRNKMEFTFSDVRWLLPQELGDKNITKKNALGFHAPGAFDRVMDIKNCELQDAKMNRILNMVREYVKEKELSFYNLHEREGLMRFLILRRTHFTDEIMVNIVTTSDAEEQLSELADNIRKEIPEVVSVINSVNSGLAQVAYGESYKILSGQDHITEELDGLRFVISHGSFFQTNSAQALNLYNVVKEFAGLTGNEIIWDLYGGTGTIAIFLAPFAAKVISVELIDVAVEDGKVNVKANNIDNVEFVHGDMRELIHNLPETPDVVITDPPRDGMHPKVVKSLMEREIPRIVYVSCNPTTLARDLNLLKEEYKILKIKPVDMFPQTYHIETVVLLERK